MYSRKRVYPSYSASIAKRQYLGPGKAVGNSNAAKLQRLQRVVSALKPETKVFTTLVTVSGPSVTTGTVSYLSGVATGATNITRIGKKIRLSKIRLQLRTGTPMNGAWDDQISFYLIKDKRSNGVVPTNAGAADSIFSSASPFTAVINPTNMDRFSVVWAAHTSGIKQTQGIEGCSTFNSINAKDVLTYQDDTAAQSGADMNAYYFVILSSDSGAASEYYITCSFEFTDV